MLQLVQASEARTSGEENPKRHCVFARPLLRRLDVQPVVGELPLQRVMRAEQFDARDLALFQAGATARAP
jgi:hypothetical protein